MIRKKPERLVKEKSCKPRSDDKAGSTELAIERYYKLKRPAFRIALLSLVLFTCFLGIVLIIMPNAINLGQGHITDRIIFMLYFSIFTANWLVYFRSKKTYYKNERDGIQSLRRLLGEASKHWNDATSYNNLEDKHDSFKNKSSTSMTVISILA
ncbi:MAG: hypothetical protein Q9M24_02715 [Mariprofundaceae bacterium]|nr:hypothetical protein [Mariprofundaceae bacterium]